MLNPLKHTSASLLLCLNVSYWQVPHGSGELPRDLHSLVIGTQNGNPTEVVASDSHSVHVNFDTWGSETD